MVGPDTPKETQLTTSELVNQLEQGTLPWSSLRRAEQRLIKEHVLTQTADSIASSRPVETVTDLSQRLGIPQSTIKTWLGTLDDNLRKARREEVQSNLKPRDPDYERRKDELKKYLLEERDSGTPRRWSVSKLAAEFSLSKSTAHVLLLETLSRKDLEDRKRATFRKEGKGAEELRAIATQISNELRHYLGLRVEKLRSEREIAQELHVGKKAVREALSLHLADSERKVRETIISLRRVHPSRDDQRSIVWFLREVFLSSHVPRTASADRDIFKDYNQFRSASDFDKQKEELSSLGIDSSLFVGVKRQKSDGKFISIGSLLKFTAQKVVGSYDNLGTVMLDPSDLNRRPSHPVKLAVVPEVDFSHLEEDPLPGKLLNAAFKLVKPPGLIIFSAGVNKDIGTIRRFHGACMALASSTIEEGAGITIDNFNTVYRGLDGYSKRYLGMCFVTPHRVANLALDLRELF